MLVLAASALAAFELCNPHSLQGKIGRDTLKAGDHVIITGNPARNRPTRSSKNREAHT